MDKIEVRGARTHNLKNINLVIPRDKLIVVTGLSGSGKSSLAFDTLYAEGQRRYVESLSAYARQFLSLMEKPDVDHIEGLSPAISIEQKSTSHNLLFHLAGRFITPGFGSSQRNVGNCATIWHVAYFRVLTQITNENNLVYASAGHVRVS